MQKGLLVLIWFFAGLSELNAQAPYRWSFKAKKLAHNTFEIHCVMDVSSPWHVYSQFTPEGGPLPTKFVFSKNPLYTLEGKAKENGKMITRHESVFGIDVDYFEGGVDFVQVVKFRGNAATNFSGSVEFMVCNDEQCLPPVTQKFSLPLTK